MILVASFFLYPSDHTRTIPANGKYSEDQRTVYQAVLDANKAVIAAAKPGVNWQDMAILSAKVMAKALLEAGLFQNGSVDEIIEEGILAYFYPHGLGHGLGLDCHEIAGWEKGHQRPQKAHLAPLRYGRVLKPGVVITVEPGLYFLPNQIKKVLNDPVKAKYVNQEICERFQRNVGGVRIEDDILITEDGNRILVTVPKEIDEIEAVISKR